MSDAATASEWPSEAGTIDGSADPGPDGARLNQPWRAAVAVIELALAAIVVWGAFALWDAGTTELVTRLTDGTTLTSHQLAGENAAGAIGLGALAGLLVIDAVRQLLLAFRANRRRRRKPGK